MDEAQLLTNCHNTRIHTLAFLQSELQRAQSELIECRRYLDATELPIHYWERQAQNQLQRFQKQHSLSHRDFERALNAIPSQPLKETPMSPKSKLELGQPPPAKGLTKTTLYQTAKVEVVDGQVITTVDLNAAFWLASGFREDAYHICRQMHFINGVIPEPYRYVCDVNGEPCQTKEHLMIYFSNEEFERICQLEVETNSPHLLEGKCEGFHWQGCDPLKKGPIA